LEPALNNEVTKRAIAHILHWTMH